jgi:hypothetical protein
MKKDNHRGCPSISIAVVKPYLFAVFFAGNNGKMITANRATTSNTTNMSFGFKYLFIKRLIAFRKGNNSFLYHGGDTKHAIFNKIFFGQKTAKSKIIKKLNSLKKRVYFHFL